LPRPPDGLLWSELLDAAEVLGHLHDLFLGVEVAAVAGVAVGGLVKLAVVLCLEAVVDLLDDAAGGLEAPLPAALLTADPALAMFSETGDPARVRLYGK